MSRTPSVRRLALLPGMHGTTRLFDRFVAALPAGLAAQPIGYPVDRPLGYEELLELVLPQLPRDVPYAVLAESFSGPVGIDLAARRPPGLEALVLAVTFATSPLPFWLRAIGGLVGPRMAAASAPRSLLGALLLSGDPAPDLLEETVAEVDATHADVLAARLRAMIARRPDPTRDTPIQVPVLCLSASRDRVLRRRGVASIRARVPQAEFVELDGPHMLLQRHPREAAAVIARFLLA